MNISRTEKTCARSSWWDHRKSSNWIMLRHNYYSAFSSTSNSNGTESNVLFCLSLAPFIFKIEKDSLNSFHVKIWSDNQESSGIYYVDCTWTRLVIVDYINSKSQISALLITIENLCIFVAVVIVVYSIGMRFAWCFFNFILYTLHIGRHALRSYRLINQI